MLCANFAASVGNATDICSVQPKIITSDAGIAGIGTFWSFIIAASLSMFVSLLLLLLDGFSTRPQTLATHRSSEATERAKIRQTLRSFLLGLSDTQLIKSLSLLITLERTKCDGMTVYHYNMVAEYILIATVAHAFSLLMLVQWFRIRPMLALLRAVLIITLNVWATIYAFQGRRMAAGTDPKVAFLAACYLSGLRTPDSFNYIGYALLVFTLAAATTPFVIFIHVRRFWDSHRLAYGFRILVQALLPLIAFGWGLYAINQGRNAFTTHSSPVRLTDDSQNVLSFGQILALTLVGWPVLLAAESWPASKRLEGRILDPENYEKGAVNGFFKLGPGPKGYTPVEEIALQPNISRG